MSLLVFYVLLALGFSFLCSILEATLLSLSPTAVLTAKSRGEAWAEVMERLKSDIDRPLSAILTLNTIAHTMGAAGAGAQYAKVYGSGTEAVFAAILTLAILIFTEIIPKTIGARYARTFAAPAAWLLPKLEWVLAPLVWLCRKITRLITFGDPQGTGTYREDILAVAQIGEKEGFLQAGETAVVRNVLLLETLHIDRIMTPRPVVFMLDEATPLEHFVRLSKNAPYSRIPLYREDSGEITGFVLRADVLLACLNGEQGTLERHKRQLAEIPDHVTVDKLFTRLLAEGHHMMLVHDEFGTTVGIVTLEDVLESIVGVEIVDEQDKIADLQALARGRWAARARKLGLPEEREEPADGGGPKPGNSAP